MEPAITSHNNALALSMKSHINTYHRLDRLGLAIPLVDFAKIDVRRPALVRVLVDSGTAKTMLEMNIKNRLQRRGAVEYIKRQILSGEWRDDHPQPVIFSDHGRLIDGQHRLQAISEMNIGKNEALVVRVETGARDDVRQYLDTGVPRSLEDRVELVENPVHNKVIARLCAFDFQLNMRTSRKPSPEDAKDFFLAHSKSLLFVANNHKKDKGTGRIQVAYAAMEYYEIAPTKAQAFYPAIFVVDSDIQQARVLRDLLLRSLSTIASKKSTGGERNDIYYRSVAAMKAHQRGKPISILRKATW